MGTDVGTGAQLAMLPWFVRDYLAATGHLSPAERGVYTDLLFASWEMGPLPKDPVRLARLGRCDAGEFGQIWPAIREKFSETADGLVNARLEEHRAESRRRSQTARQKAEKRWHADSPGLFDNTAADAPAHAAASAAAAAAAYARSMLPSPSPSPSPDPSPHTDTCPQERTATAKPAYHGKEFHDQIIAAYHEVLPDLPQVKIWGADRAKSLNARIRERCSQGKPADGAEYWRGLFGKVALNDHWCGRKADSTWSANLEWLLKPANFTKVVEWQPPRGSANGVHHGR
jgi:uncharacterized protein YdaU (DUF1376 family)